MWFRNTYFKVKCFNLLQLYLVAYDSEREWNKDYTYVYITVRRNEGRPTWSLFTPNVAMPEDKKTFTSVAQVLALDTVDGVRDCTRDSRSI